jgi:hypothetical protein
MLFVASAINIILQTFYFTSARFSFQYDDTKLVIDRVGDFTYDDDGNLDTMTIYVKNKDPDNPYSGYIEVIIDSQKYRIDVNIKKGKTESYEIDLEPNITMTDPLIINVNVIISGVVTADFIAQKGVAISDVDIDGVIGTEWDDAKQYDDVPITPSGTAKIWIKNDGANLYLAI